VEGLLLLVCGGELLLHGGEKPERTGNKSARPQVCNRILRTRYMWWFPYLIGGESGASVEVLFLHDVLEGY